MYSRESYECPALHLFKEFRDGEFRGGRKEMYGNISILAKGNGLKAGHNHNEANSIVFGHQLQATADRHKRTQAQVKSYQNIKVEAQVFVESLRDCWEP